MTGTLMCTEVLKTSALSHLNRSGLISNLGLKPNGRKLMSLSIRDKWLMEHAFDEGIHGFYETF